MVEDNEGLHVLETTFNCHLYIPANLCPEKFKGTEIEDLYIKSELAKMTIEQRIKHEEGIMTRNDILNSISEQIEEARKEAIEIGIREGRAEGRAEGIEEGTIAEALEITIEQCESYR